MRAVRDAIHPVRKALISCCCILGATALTASPDIVEAAEPAPETIQLSYLGADDVVPVVESMVGDEGWVRAVDRRLVVATDAATMKTVRAMISELDVPRSPLRLTLDDRAPTATPAGSSVYSTRRNEKDGMPISMQLLEGVPAWVENGVSVPVIHFQGAWFGAGRGFTAGQDYLDVTSGFYALATLNGERVTLSISVDRNRLMEGSAGPISVDRVATTVQGRLGEWIPVVTGPGDTESPASGTHVVASTRQDSTRSLWVRVDRL